MGQASSSQHIQTFVFQQQEDVQIPPPQQQPRKCYKAAKKPTQNSSQQATQSTSKMQSEKPSAIQKSLEMKNLGNNYIINKQYDKAIECYTQAIVISYQQENIYPGDSIYYSNRAVANKQLNKLSEAKADAEAAIKLDEQNARAHFVNGTIRLIEVQRCTEISESLIKQAHIGLQFLDKAYQYIKDNTDEQKSKLKVLINQNLGKGRRMVFLLAQEMDRRNVQTLKQLLAGIATRNNKKLDFDYIDKQLNKKTLQDIPVPAYFQCIVTYEIMNEPIHFNTGLTYEKKSIEQQFKSNGYVDPITRADMDPYTARLNVQLLQGINQLRQKYGWIGIEHENDYKTIKFE